MKLAISCLASILITIGLWFAQNLLMYALSEQYRVVGYIEYGSFLQMSGIMPQLGIVLAPFLSSVLIFLKYGKIACKSLTEVDDRVALCMFMGGLFVVLTIRTAVISIQGYALIFI